MLVEPVIRSTYLTAQAGRASRPLDLADRQAGRVVEKLNLTQQPSQGVNAPKGLPRVRKLPPGAPALVG